MRNGAPRIRATKRSLAMLEAVIADGGRSSISALARATEIPVATAHRQVVTLVAEGYLTATVRGRHIAGPRLLGLLHRLDEKQIIVEIAGQWLDRLAEQLGTVVQLGTLESDMVTYRIKTGRKSAELFTKVGMQLEAYCSGIGKMLLAHLSDPERDAYLAAGPFPALTSRTITDPVELRGVLRQVREAGSAFDRGEILEGIHCVAVPLLDQTGKAHAAISATFTDARHAEEALPAVMQTARAIEIATFGTMRI